jgi:hypothetical protein
MDVIMTPVSSRPERIVGIVSPQGVSFPPTPENLRRMKPVKQELPQPRDFEQELRQQREACRDLQNLFHREQDLHQRELQELRAQLSEAVQNASANRETQSAHRTSANPESPFAHRTSASPEFQSAHRTSANPEFPFAHRTFAEFPNAIRPIAEYPVSHLRSMDSSFNIIPEFADCFQLEQKLLIERKGIATLYEFFLFISKEYETLEQQFALISEGASLDFCINRFRNTIRALKKPNFETEAVLTILAVHQFCPNHAERLESTLLGAASMTSEQRKYIAVSFCPSIDSSQSSTCFDQLPGILEIFDGSVTVDSLVRFVLDRVSFVQDSRMRLDLSKEVYRKLNGADYTDCVHLFADIGKQFNICSSWKGSALTDDGDRIEHFLSLCPEIVRIAWIDFISQPTNEINTLHLRYSEFQNHMQSVWASAMSKQHLLKRLNPAIQKPVPVRIQKSSIQPAQIQQPSASVTLKDIEITCRGCRQPFTFAVGQQEFHAKMGFNSNPAWCKECKPATAIDEDKSNRLKELPCYDFGSGKCTRGSACRFKHSDPKSINSIAKTTEAEFEDTDDDEGFQVVRHSKTTVYDTTPQGA